eukprot:TRINITY_DN8399_c0_g2_i1.p1 TRINITY_DN8399_c0_g2~~TRINITY_DN8399_c0_g2_i1.p1  ORF type:complete len:139 (+),score=35.46 TRINITY_DN8399_c0_g2_i1:108-524(+)
MESFLVDDATMQLINTPPNSSQMEPSSTEAQLLNNLQVLENLGNTFFDRILKSVEQPYLVEDAKADRNEVMRQLNAIREAFTKEQLISLRVPSESAEKPEPVEEAIQRYHMGLEKTKHRTNLCLQRLAPPPSINTNNK